MPTTAAQEPLRATLIGEMLGLDINCGPAGVGRISIRVVFILQEPGEQLFWRGSCTYDHHPWSKERYDYGGRKRVVDVVIRQNPDARSG